MWVVIGVGGSEWGSLTHRDFAAHWCWAYHCNHFSFNFWTKALTVHLVEPYFWQWEAEGELLWRSTFMPFYLTVSQRLVLIFLLGLFSFSSYRGITAPNDQKVSGYVTGLLLNTTCLKIIWLASEIPGFEKLNFLTLKTLQIPCTHCLLPIAVTHFTFSEG